MVLTFSKLSLSSLAIFGFNFLKTEPKLVNVYLGYGASHFRSWDPGSVFAKVGTNLQQQQGQQGKGRNECQKT
jgi:hypothetical protein